MKFSEKYITMKELPVDLAEEEGVAMAVAQLKKINDDREMRQILEAREKEAHHLASIKKAAHDEGHEAGLAEGEARGERKKQVEIAIKLSRQGMPVSLIAETTGLSEIELKEVLSQ
jgi:flagellar biosynthesis/type III secretory pathway protein FliH